MNLYCAKYNVLIFNWICKCIIENIKLLKSLRMWWIYWKLRKKNNIEKILWTLLCFIYRLVARADKIFTLFMCKKLAQISGLCKFFDLLHVCEAEELLLYCQAGTPSSAGRRSRILHPVIVASFRKTIFSRQTLAWEALWVLRNASHTVHCTALQCMCAQDQRCNWVQSLQSRIV
jgi:hypothetical protein